MQRRKFLKSLALSPILVAGADANLDFSKIKSKASIIDIDRCDGCTGFDVPKCVSACKEKNAARFPKPVEESLIIFRVKSMRIIHKNKTTFLV